MSDLINQWNFVKENISTIKKQYHASQSVNLIAVSKTFPVEDIRTLYHAGQRAFGENYVQEWIQKVQQTEDLAIEWHIIGHIQSNKSQLVAEHAHWVHTIDRVKIAQRLNNQRPPYLPPLNVCIEINISNEPQKHGIIADDLLSLAEQIAQLPHLQLRGLMCVATENADDDTLKQEFNNMSVYLQQLQNHGFHVDTLSMGMSHDMQVAIMCGATHIRIGRAIFGHRQRKNSSL